MTVVERSTKPVRQVATEWVESLLAGSQDEPGSPLRLARRWAEAVEKADEAFEQLQALTPGVGAFYDAYAGSLHPDVVTQAATEAGLRLNQTDLGLLAFAVGAFRGVEPLRATESGSPAGDTAWLNEMIEGPSRGWSPACREAIRWAEATGVARDVAVDQLVASDDDVMVFYRTYRGPRDPDRLAEAAAKAGLGLDDSEAGLLALAIGLWRP